MPWLSIQRNILQHKIESLTMLGQIAPSFRKLFSPKVLPVSQHVSFLPLSEQKLNPHAEEGVNRTEPLGQVGEKNVVIVDTTHQCTDLLHVLGHRHIGQCVHFFCARA